MNGVTGRMGDQPAPGALDPGDPRAGRARRSADGEALWPEPMLVGRDERKLRALAERARPGALDDRPRRGARRPDADDLLRRPGRRSRARTRVRAGDRRRQARLLREAADRDARRGARARPRWRDEAGVKHGVVQDKLFLPGLPQAAAAGRQRASSAAILSVRGEFGYWVFEGDWPPAQRPSWNYRAQDGGGIVARHVLPLALRARRAVRRRARRVRATARPTSPSAATSRARRYDATAEDAAYAIFELAGGVVAQINSSWCVRVVPRRAVRAPGRRHRGHRGRRPARAAGSSRARRRRGRSGTRTSRTRSTSAAGWHRGAGHERVRQRVQGAVGDVPAPRRARRAVPLGLPTRAREGVQLAELGLRSWHERRWVEVPEL